MSHFLLDLKDIVFADAVAVGLDTETAHALSHRIANSVKDYGGGGSVYVHKTTIDKKQRDAEIYRRWNGKNMRELMRDYDLTEVRIYAIINEQRALRQADWTAQV